MRFSIPLTQDDANSYPRGLELTIEDLGDELRLELRDPDRVVSIRKQDLKKVMRVLED